MGGRWGMRRMLHAWEGGSGWPAGPPERPRARMPACVACFVRHLFLPAARIVQAESGNYSEAVVASTKSKGKYAGR